MNHAISVLELAQGSTRQHHGVWIIFCTDEEGIWQSGPMMPAFPARANHHELKSYRRV